MNSLNLFSLKNKTALITGSGSGIGFALAEGLAGAGARIILNGRNKEKLDTAARRLEEKEVRVFKMVFNVTDSHAVKTAIQKFEQEEGAIDILINNAGINIRGPFADFEVSEWEKVLDTHVNGAMIVSQVVGNFMLKRKAGKIINICSVQSELGRPSIVPYTVAKGGEKMLTKALATEWGGENIQVNGIGPGYFATELTKPLKDNPEFDKWLCNRTPAGRWGDVNELIGAAVFLSSEASNYVNGHILNVDGGLLACI